VRFLLFFAAAALLAQQQPTGPFRPGTNPPAGLPPTVPQKGPAFYPNRVAFIDSLGLLDGLTGNATDCIHIDGSSGPCTSGGGGGGSSVVPIFSWFETPGGTQNGVNTVFTLANSPSPANSLHLYWNGDLLEAGVDYTLSGGTITYINGVSPKAGDVMQAWYQEGYSAAIPLTCPANEVVAGPASGPDAAPGCRDLVSGDLPAISTAWGAITGTLASQTDLNTALGTKPTAALVTSVGSPGIDTNVASEKATRTALTAVAAAAQPVMGIGTSLPGTCTVGALFYKSDATAGQNVYGCTSTNTWTQQGGSGGGGGTVHDYFTYFFVSRDNSNGDAVTDGVCAGGGGVSCGNYDGPAYYDLPSAGTGYIVVHHLLHPSWDASTVALTLYWTQTSGGSGNVQWSFSSWCAAVGSTVYFPSPTYNTAQTVTTAIPGGGNLQETSLASVTMTGCAAGNILYVKIQNIAAGSGGTTFTNDPLAMGLGLLIGHT
jgi:hypothetical protein